MLRKSDLLWLTVAAIAGVELFHTSYRVQNLREEIATLDREIIAEQSGIQVTKAEWGVYTDPVRLEALAGSYLTTLTPITAAQVASFNALPLKPGTPPGGMALVASNPEADGFTGQWPGGGGDGHAGFRLWSSGFGFRCCASSWNGSSCGGSPGFGRQQRHGHAGSSGSDPPQDESPSPGGWWASGGPDPRFGCPRFVGFASAAR